MWRKNTVTNLFGSGNKGFPVGIDELQAKEVLDTFTQKYTEIQAKRDMDLLEAIRHCEEKKGDESTACEIEHGQLWSWLRELDTLRRYVKDLEESVSRSNFLLENCRNESEESRSKAEFIAREFLLGSESYLSNNPLDVGESVYHQAGWSYEYCCGSRKGENHPITQAQINMDTAEFIRQIHEAFLVTKTHSIHFGTEKSS